MTTPSNPDNLESSDPPFGIPGARWVEVEAPYFDSAAGESVTVRARAIDMSEPYARIRRIADMATTPLWDVRTQVHDAMDEVFSNGAFGPLAPHNYLRAMDV